MRQSRLRPDSKPLGRNHERIFCCLFAAAAYFFPRPLTGAREKSNPTDAAADLRDVPGPRSSRFAELRAYAKKAMRREIWSSWQVRDIDIGKAHIGIGMVLTAASSTSRAAGFGRRSTTGQRGLSHQSPGRRHSS